MALCGLVQVWWSPTGKPVAPSNTPVGRNPEQEPPAKAGARVEGSSLGIGIIGGLVFARENSPAEQTGQLDVQITRRQRVINRNRLEQVWAPIVPPLRSVPVVSSV